MAKSLGTLPYEVHHENCEKPQIKMQQNFYAPKIAKLRCS